VGNDKASRPWVPWAGTKINYDESRTTFCQLPNQNCSQLLLSTANFQPNSLTLSAELPDWSREHPRRFWDPSRRLLRSIRRYQFWAQKRGPHAAIMKKRWVLSHHFWSVITGAEISVVSQIGGGLLIPHPNGIVINPNSVIGPNCLIMQQVTIGARGRKCPGTPVLDGHVDVGAGAKILGPIYIGSHVKIGANAVVISDIPSGAVAVGIPAKILKPAK